MTWAWSWSLWQSLNEQKTPEEKIAIEEKRKAVAAKRKTYAKIMDECGKKLHENKDLFSECFKKFGNPSSNKLNQDPFFHLVVSKKGLVSKIEHFSGGSESVKPCLEKILKGFQFSPFSSDEEIELYVTSFPSCRTGALDKLLNWFWGRAGISQPLNQQSEHFQWATFDEYLFRLNFEESLRVSGVDKDNAVPSDFVREVVNKLHPIFIG
jgi:hypothetical protein